MKQAFGIGFILIAISAGTGCATTAQLVRDASNEELGVARRLGALDELANRQCTQDVQLTLLYLLDDDDLRIQYFTVEALGDCYITDSELELAIDRRKCEFLDVTETKEFCMHKLRLWACGRTRSLRVATLALLHAHTGKDFGFDQAAWEQYLSHGP